LINLPSHRLSGASTPHRRPARPSSSLQPGSTHQRRRHGHDRAAHLVSGGRDDQLFSAFILCICYHAATRQDKPAPSGPTSRASCVVVSCGVRLSEVGLSEIRKPQVRVCFLRAYL